MARPVMLGNGSLTVGLNERGLVHDFYYPYVGLDNLATARSVHHLTGVWVNGTFSWVDDGDWTIDIDFETDALISTISMTNTTLKIRIDLVDCVDYEYNALLRRVKVTNMSEENREIRLFMHRVFQISRAGRADTALFIPDENYILDYKGRCCLLIYAQDEDGQPYDQYAIGNYGIEGKEGTFRDAEDGELSGSPVEHGGVDSVLRFSSAYTAGASCSYDYWIVAADSQYGGEAIHNKIKSSGLLARQKVTRQLWNSWLAIGADKLAKIDAQYLPLTKKSLMLIKAHTDKLGGVIASCDSTIYNYGRDYYSYVWPRDGAFALWPLIRLGYTEEPKKFFEFCRDILHDGYLMHKYQPDRAIGSSWHPMVHGKHKELAIQEDETAIVLFMLGEYYDYTQDEAFIKNMYSSFIKPAAEFMQTFVDTSTGLPHASYDLWEEKFLASTYSTAVTYQALKIAADFADMYTDSDLAESARASAERMLQHKDALYSSELGAYRKGFLLQEDGSLQFDDTLDVSSLYGVMMFNFYDETADQLHQSVKTVEEHLLAQSPSGGSPRYNDDNYFASDPKYLGNPWFVTTLWLAQYYLRVNKAQQAHDLLQWTMQHTLPSGVLSEQVHPETGAPIGVAPLVWSHAEFINTVLDLNAD